MPGALLAAVSGWLDLLVIPRPSRAFQIGLTHMVINLVIAGIFIVGFFWRQSATASFASRAWFFVTCLVLVGVWAPTFAF